MALSVIGLHSSLDRGELSCGVKNSSIRSIPMFMGVAANNPFDQFRIRRDFCRLRCGASSEISAAGSRIESQAADKSVWVEDDDLGPAIKFEMSDFVVSDRVSIGLGGRGDEAVYEATVQNPDSPLNNTRVVLRELMSVHAKRRGRRAIEVLRKLTRRRFLYHSYSMQVHGYVSPPPSGNGGSFILVHGYHGSFSLRHWLQQSDWLPTLEATLALDEESVRRVGDDTVGGPAVSRKLRMIRVLMRDLLIGVNYLHSHGLAHTELRLENIHISPVDRHIKVGILGNAADFYDEANSNSNNVSESSMDRRQMMIAFDMRCVGYMMVKMVLKELMEPLIFTRFKSFLIKGNDPSCLREFLLPILTKNSSIENAGLQILDRYWGAGWHLLSQLLTTKPSERISCLDALRHPFLCGPKWRVEPSMNIIRWGLGSTAVRIAEEYIYGRNQRSRLAYFIELMEMLNPNPRPKNWRKLLPGRWRLLYSTGRHIGLTLRQPVNRVLIGDVNLTVIKTNDPFPFMFTTNICLNVLPGQSAWPHDKSGTSGRLRNKLLFKVRAGKRIYETEEEKETSTTFSFSKETGRSSNSIALKLSGRRWRKVIPFNQVPSNLPVAKLVSSNEDVDMTMNLDSPLSRDVDVAKRVLNEIRIQVPPVMFDLSNIVCGSYVDSRLLILRSVDGSALLFVRSCEDT